MAKRLYYNSRKSNPLQSIIGFVVMILFFYLLFSFAFFVFKFMWYYATPVFVLATLFIDYKVLTNFGNWILQRLKTDPISGLFTIGLTVIGLPIVTGYLLSKALFKKKITKMTKQFQEEAGGTDEEFVDYEEIDSEPIELPDLPPKSKQRADNNKYDDLFE